jgi:hypothetical protein
LIDSKKDQLRTHGDELSWTDRYFLRRLALARRDRSASEAASYSSALFEVTLITVFAPCLAVFSSVVITSLRWTPTFGHRHPNFSPKLTGLAIGMVALIVGSAWFGRRFRKLRVTPGAWCDFDTPEDRRIVFRQKVAILTICGAVVPLMALAATFWIL